MRRFIFFVLVASLVFMAGSASADEVQTSLDIGAGYRTDKIDWNATDGITDPLFEDVWSSMDTVYTKARVRMSYKKFYMRGSFGYGRVIDGGHRESDYSASGRTAEAYRLESNVNGYLYDTSIAAGYQALKGKVSIIPLVGYSWHVQKLSIDNSVITVCDTTVYPTCTTGTLSGYPLDYRPRWQGPWLGIDVAFQPTDKVRLFASAEYHWGELHANAFIDIPGTGLFGYEQVADAEGFTLSGGFAYAIKDTWDIGMESAYTRWKTDGGSYGLNSTWYNLNRVNWESFNLMFNATHRFYSATHNKRLNKM